MRLRRHDARRRRHRLLLRHHPLRAPRRAARGDGRGLRGAARRAAGRGVRRRRRHALRGGRRHRPAHHHRRPAGASSSSIAPVTASASRSTKTPTSSRATARRWSPATRSRSSPASTCPAGSASASRTSWWPPTRGPIRSTAPTTTSPCCSRGAPVDGLARPRSGVPDQPGVPIDLGELLTSRLEGDEALADAMRAPRSGGTGGLRRERGQPAADGLEVADPDGEVAAQGRPGAARPGDGEDIWLQGPRLGDELVGQVGEGRVEPARQPGRPWRRAADGGGAERPDWPTRGSRWAPWIAPRARCAAVAARGAAPTGRRGRTSSRPPRWRSGKPRGPRPRRDATAGHPAASLRRLRGSADRPVASGGHDPPRRRHGPAAVGGRRAARSCGSPPAGARCRSATAGCCAAPTA